MTQVVEQIKEMGHEKFPVPRSGNLIPDRPAAFAPWQASKHAKGRLKKKRREKKP